MTTQSTSKTNEKLPNPVYAAAGVGDLAYQQLRKLPAKVAELRGRVSEGDLDLKVEVDKLRAGARRNAAAFKTGALAAQDKASSIYTDLVARGQHVVRTGRAARTGSAVPAVDTASPAAVTGAPTTAQPPLAKPAGTEPTVSKPAGTEPTVVLPGTDSPLADQSTVATPGKPARKKTGEIK